MENNFAASMDNTSNTEPFDIKVGLASLVPQWCRTVMIAFMVIVFVTGLPGNIFVLIVQIGAKVKTTTDWFIIFLAVSDVLSLVVNIPCYIITMADEWQNVGSDIGCKVHHFVIVLTFEAQTIIVAMNAVDRLWKSSSVNQLFSPKRAIKTGIFAFALSTGLGTFATFSVGNNILGQCILVSSKRILQLTLYLIMLITVTVSSGVIVVSYTRILLILKARNRVGAMSNIPRIISQNTARVGDPRYEKALHTTKFMFIVTVVFIMTTIIPNVTVLILSRTDYRNNFYGSIVVFLLTRVYLINICANPYIYFCLNTSFRRKIISLKNSIV